MNKKKRSVRSNKRRVKNCIKHPSSIEILTTKKFQVDGQIYSLKKMIARGNFGITLSAKCKGNKIAVKAILPSSDDIIYQIQELENQYYLHCMFGELKAARFPETHFLAQYKDTEDDYLQLMYDHDITDTPIAGMKYLQHNLADTFYRLYTEGNDTELAELSRTVLTAVATTLEEVNQQVSFVHGDLHVGNIMHDNGTFYIIDFGASRIGNGHQLPLEPNGYYSDEIGSSGLDLLTLSLSIADWCDTTIDNLFELWYPLWKFYKTRPIGRYEEFHAHQALDSSEDTDDNGEMKVVVDRPWINFSDPSSACFLGTGYKTDCEWPLGDQLQDDNVERVETWHYYGYAAGDQDPNVASIFSPSVFLNGSPEDDTDFMEAMTSTTTEPGLFTNIVSAVIDLFTFNEQPQFHTYIHKL